MISLLIIMVLITSKLALSRSIDCTTLTEEALRAQQRLVKFDTFFEDLVPMKAYVYNSLVYNFVNRKLHCTDVENHYRIRFNWTSRVGIYQLYSNLAEMCSIVTVFKDGNGNVQFRAGIEGHDLSPKSTSPARPSVIVIYDLLLPKLIIMACHTARAAP
ncbi:hypothetical protein pipiens_007690 [Culex pipiens pipiens]|uniref:Uncharacterized protein n=1 Tax=Culex pipiens pipiens TaxID=38569 RepID=A0ABD1DK64_CULPP